VNGAGHIPLADLEVRRAELPPRDAAVLVMAEDGTCARAAAERIEALGYGHVLWLDASLAELPPVLVDTAPAARLWRPSPFLEAMVPRLPDPAGGECRVLDLAAGAGREAVFLAQRGYHVEAWDHDRGALDKARALAERHGVDLHAEVRDLERRDPRLPVGEHHVVMVFRFLHRPLFPRIAAAVAPGGCVVYETYLKGQERFGRPKHPRFLLDSGELPGHFLGFTIEHYEESTPASGPLLARLLARRPVASSASTSLA
jgi:SAM-dependent methyltransferase